MWPAMEAFYVEIKTEGGLKVNWTKPKVQSPNGNYEGKQQEFQIGSPKAILPNHINGESPEITAEGLTIGESPHHKTAILYAPASPPILK